MAQSSSTPEHEQGNKENHTPSRCCACCFPCHGESLLRCDPHSCCRLTCISALEAELSCAICLDICVRPCTTPCGEPCLGLVKSASVCSMLGPQAPAPAPAQDLLLRTCSTPTDSGSCAGHSFCRRCLTEALRHQRQCPRCRTQLPAGV